MALKLFQPVVQPVELAELHAHVHLAPVMAVAQPVGPLGFVAQVFHHGGGGAGAGVEAQLGVDAILEDEVGVALGPADLGQGQVAGEVPGAGLPHGVGVVLHPELQQDVGVLVEEGPDHHREHDEGEREVRGDVHRGAFE